MEQKFGINSIDVRQLRNFCELEGESVHYQKGVQMECEGRPSQWFGFVTEGCFKYVTRGMSDGHEHITWFSFAGEFVGDYPSCIDNSPSLTTIEAMIPSRVLRIRGEQLTNLFCRNMDTMGLRAIIGEHLLRQARSRYLDFYRTTPRERYELLMHRCPGIVEHLPLNAIASFLNISPKTMSMIRRSITFGQ